MPSFKSGQRIKCVSAREMGIPLYEGNIYTVKKYVTRPAHDWGDGSRLDLANEPGVTLIEVPGHFLASRFEAVSED